MELKVESFVANKKFTVGDRSYAPGETVDLSQMADHKISQLLNQRYIRPSN